MVFTIKLLRVIVLIIEKGEMIVVLQFNNTNPRVKFKVDEVEDGYYCAVMPLHPDGSASYIAYEGMSFYQAWNVFTQVINNDRVIVPKQFEKYLG
jgi:hypothetical protein